MLSEIIFASHNAGKIKEIKEEVKENAIEVKNSINEKAQDVKNTISEKKDEVKNTISEKFNGDKK